MADLTLALRLTAEAASALQALKAVQGEVKKTGLDAKVAADAAAPLTSAFDIPPPASLMALPATLSGIRLATDQQLQSTTSLSRAQDLLGGALQGASVDMTKLAGIETAVSAATEEEVITLGRLSAELEALRQRIAPAITAEEMLAQANQKVDAAVKAGLISQAEANALADQARARFAALPSSIEAVNSVSGRNTAIVGNMTAQWNDIIQMMIAGQNPMTTAIQQGSQLGQALGGMGAAGALRMLAAGFMSMLNPMNLAIMAGIALASATYQWVTSAGVAAEKTDLLKEKIDDLASAISALRQKETGAAEPIDLLVQKYGALASAVKEARIQLADKAFEEAKAKLDDVIAATQVGPVMPLADVLGLNQTLLKIDELRRKIKEQTELSAGGTGPFYDDTADSAALTELVAKAQRVATYIGTLRDQFRLTQGDAEKLAEALSRLGDAKDAKDQVAAAQALKENLVEVFGSVDAANKATGGLVSTLSEAIDKGADLASVAGQIGGNFGGTIAAGQALVLLFKSAHDAAQTVADVNIASGIESALGPAASLASKLWDAATAAANIQAGEQVRRIPGGVDAIASGDMQWSGGHAHRPVIVPSSGNSSGTSGGSSDDTVASLGKDAKDALATLNTAVAQINEKVKAGLISTADASKAISDARAKANDDLTLIIAKIEQMGPAGAAAAAELRTHLFTATDAMAKEMADLSASMGDTFKSSFIDAVMGSQDAFSGFISFMERKLLELSYDKFLSGPVGSLMDGIVSGLGGLFGGGTGGSFKFALGGVPAVPELVQPVRFALGGIPALPKLPELANTVLAKATPFAMPHGGTGVAGEAGPEAIMPLKSGGVRAVAAGGLTAILPLTRAGDGSLAVDVTSWSSPGLQRMSAFAAGGVVGGGTYGLVGEHAEGSSARRPIVNIQPPAGHEARVEERVEGGNEQLTVVFDAIENHLAGRIGSGRGNLVAAMMQSFGMGRVAR